MKYIFLLAIILGLSFLGYQFYKSGKLNDISNNLQGKSTKMTLTSTAFNNNGTLPAMYTCDGEDVNPPLTYTNLPANTQSLALTVEDINSPKGIFTHWVIFNIDPTTTTRIDSNSVPGEALQGMNDFNQARYSGPCPASGSHNYVFTLYALDTKLPLFQGVKKQVFVDQISGHVLDKAELTASYQKN